MRVLTRGLFALVSAVLCASAALAQSTVPTQHNNPSRTGLQLDTQLTRASVTSNFGLLFTRNFPSVTAPSPGLRERTYAQPLVDVLPNGNTIVIVATDFNNVYAFDALDPSASAPLWSRNLGPPEIVATGQPNDGCGWSLPAVGVLSTPVIYNHMLYVVAKTADLNFTIHRIDVVTGMESPVATIAPPGFDATNQVQRAGLVFVSNLSAPGGGYVYAAFSSICSRPAHGWVIGFDGNLTQQQVAAFNTSPPPGPYGAGIWQAGQAPAWFHSPDGADYLFVNTGDNLGQTDKTGKPLSPRFSESVLKLKVESNGDLSPPNQPNQPADFFTPYNKVFLDSCDGDLASAGPTILPDNQHLVTGGKQAVLYVLGLDKLGKGIGPDPYPMGQTYPNPTYPKYTPEDNDCLYGGYGTFGPYYNSATWNHNNGVIFQGDSVIQEFPVGSGGVGHIHGSPVSAVDKSGTTRIYVWPENSGLEAFTYGNTGTFDSTNPGVNTSVPQTQLWPAQMMMMDHHPMPGGALSVSSLPDQSEVIVWAIYPKFDAFIPTKNQPVPGTLYASTACPPIIQST